MLEEGRYRWFPTSSSLGKMPRQIIQIFVHIFVRNLFKIGLNLSEISLNLSEIGLNLSEISVNLSKIANIRCAGRRAVPVVKMPRQIMQIFVQIASVTLKIINFDA